MIKSSRSFSRYFITATLLIALSFLSCKSQNSDNNIVIINVEHANRISIANTIGILNDMNPKVIAIDLQFSEYRWNYQDSMLVMKIQECKNLVMGMVIEGYNAKDTVYRELTGSHEEFLDNAKIGYINAILEDDEFETLKRFSIFENVNGLTMYHFSIMTAMEFDSLAVNKFIINKPRVVEVDYRANQNFFKTFYYDDLLGNKIELEEIQGKIVLLGYTGSTFITHDYEDKFFTPLNNRKEPIEPDMWGVVYLAHIIAQVLEYSN